MKKCYVFAYGTLLDNQVRNSILRYPTHITKSAVTGFRLSQVVISGISYPILVEDDQFREQINGGYFKVNCSDLIKLDRYESPAYQRKQVKTIDNKRVWVYFNSTRN